MGVIYIGDRYTGKTSLALELVNPNRNLVRVTNHNYETLRRNLVNPITDEIIPTDAAYAFDEEYLEVEVLLRSGRKQLAVQWLDTPGEIWKPSWQVNPNGVVNPEWSRFLDCVRGSEGIFLVLAPYRERIPANHPEAQNHPRLQQWINRFERWVEFFRNDCPNAKHIVICLNKADLFCQNLKAEAGNLAYNPNSFTPTWQQRHALVCNTYFRPILHQIAEINSNTSGLAAMCFITTTHNRDLLELPWIYMAHYLAKN